MTRSRPLRAHVRFATLAVALASVTLLSSRVAPARADGPRIIDPPETEQPAPTPPPTTTAPPATETPKPAPTPAPEAGVEVLGPAWTEPPGRHRHDGVMFRILAMVDLWFASESTDNGDASLISMGVPILSGGLQLGYAVVDNLIVQVEAMFHGGPVLEAEVDGQSHDGIEGSWWGGGLGGGLTYYVMPTNLYVAAGAGIAGVSFSDDRRGRSGNTERGFFVSGHVGMEWWATDNWGVGGALRLLYVNVPDDGHTLHDIGVGIGLSATLN